MCPLRFFFNYTASTEIYTLPLHDALPILVAGAEVVLAGAGALDRHLLRAQPVQHRRGVGLAVAAGDGRERKSTRLNSSHANISYADFCLKQKHPRPADAADAARRYRSRTP